MAQQRLDLSNYDLIWSDEFDYTGTQVQKRSLMFDDVDIYGNPNDPKWIMGNIYPNQLLSANSTSTTPSLIKRENVEIHDGHLYLKATDEAATYDFNGTLYDYKRTSGRITAKYDKDYPCRASWDNNNTAPCDDFIKGFNYGIFEIKAKLPRNAGDLSAFWLWSGYWQCGNDASQYSCNVDSHGVPGYDFFPGWEIDVFEAKQLANPEDFVYWATIQANGLSQPEGCRHCATHYDWNNSNPAEMFHTYTVAWTPDRVTWFIDGNEIRSEYTNQHHGISQFKMNLILSINNFMGANSDPFIVDYIRVYRPKGINYGTNYAYYCDGNYQGQYIWSGYSATDRMQYESIFANTPYTINQNYRKIATQQPTVENLADYNNGTEVTSLVSYDVNSIIHRLFYTKKDGNLYQMNTTGSIFSNPITITSGLHQNTNIVIHPSNGNVYWKDNSNRLKVLYWTGSTTYGIGNIDVSWQYPNDVKGGITVSPSNSHHGTRVYYISTSNDRLCYYEYCSGWHRHETPVTNVKELVISNNPQGKIYYRSNDNNVWVIWKYWDNNTPCNSSNTVSGWNYAPLHVSLNSTTYTSNYDKCAGDLAVTPDGSKVFYRTSFNQLAYWNVQGTVSLEDETGITDVVGEIKANQMSDGRTEIFYIANNTSDIRKNKIKTYYERTVPQLNGETLWQNSTLDVFSPGQGGIGPNANYSTGYYTGNTIAVSNLSSTKVFFPYNQTSNYNNLIYKYMGAYIEGTNWSPLPHVPYEDCHPFLLEEPYYNGSHIGLEGKIQYLNEEAIPELQNVELEEQLMERLASEQNTIYPNPALNNFTVELTTEWCDATIQIYDNQGKLITTQHNVCHQTIFDVHEFPSGIYLVRITKDEKAQNIKVIKQ